MGSGHVFPHGDPRGEHLLAVRTREIFGLVESGVQSRQFGVELFVVADQRRFLFESFSALVASERPRSCMFVHVLFIIGLVGALFAAFLTRVLGVSQMTLLVPLEVS